MPNHRIRVAVLAALYSANALLATSACAGDIAFDGSLPMTSPGTLDGVNGVYAIDQSRGFVNDTNLFHSFERFSIDTGELAIFSGNAGITNIIARVTGGLPSSIDGTIRSTIEGANFFFVNPAGITVGPNGAIDVSGAIALGSADFITFADGTLPARGDPGAVSLLISSPVSFGFLDPSQSAGPFSNTLEVHSSDLLNRTSGAGVQLAGGAGVLLQSDQDINLSNARIYTASDLSGAITVAAAGSVTLQDSELRTDAGNLFVAPSGAVAILSGADVTLHNSSIQSAGLAGVNPIFIQGQNVDLQDSQLTLTTLAGLSPQRPTIAIAATGTDGAGVLNVVRSVISNTSLDTTPVADTSEPIGPGDITLLGDQVRLADATIVGTGRTAAAGNDIFIQGTQSISIAGVDSRSLLSVSTGIGTTATGSIVINGGSAGTQISRSDIVSQSAASASVDPDAPVGLAGIAIMSGDGRVMLEDARLRTVAQAPIDPGAATPIVTSDITVQGSSVWIRGGELTTSITPNLFSASNAADAGSILITASSIDPADAGILIDGGARLRSDATNGGTNIQGDVIQDSSDAGRISLLATGAVRISGGSSLETSAGANAGMGGGIDIFGGSIDLTNSSLNTATASSTAPPPADDFTVSVGTADINLFATGGVSLQNSQVTTQTTGTAQAGNIGLTGETLRISGGAIAASTRIDPASPVAASGKAGDITITATTEDASALALRIDNGAQIRSTATDTGTVPGLVGDAGDINISAAFGSTRMANATLASASSGANAGRSGAIIILGTGDIEVRSSVFTVANESQRTELIDTSFAGVAAITISTTKAVVSDSTFTATTTGVINGGAVAIIALGTAITNIDGSDPSQMDDGPMGTPGSLQLTRTTLRSSSTGTANAGATFVASDGDVSITSSLLENSADNPTSGLAGLAALIGNNLSIDSSTVRTSVASQTASPDDVPATIALQSFNSLTLSNSALQATTSGAVTGGDILFDAPRITVRSSSLTASSLGGDPKMPGSFVPGTAGAVNFLVRGLDPLLIADTSIATTAVAANGGNISFNANGNAFKLSNSTVVASAGGTGRGGDITLNMVANPEIRNSQIQALAAAGNGGSISIDVTPDSTQPIIIQGTRIATNASSGNGGNITLDAMGNSLRLRSSTILASAGASGTGGNILLDNLGLTIQQRSQILARADAGNGGRITLNLTNGALFLRDAQSIISADSNTGNDGEVDINSPDTDLNPATKSQEAELGETPELSANACAPTNDAAARSTFVRESRGGVGASPDDYLVSGSAAGERVAVNSEALPRVAALTGCNSQVGSKE